MYVNILYTYEEYDNFEGAITFQVIFMSYVTLLVVQADIINTRVILFTKSGHQIGYFYTLSMSTYISNGHTKKLYKDLEGPIFKYKYVQYEEVEES